MEIISILQRHKNQLLIILMFIISRTVTAALGYFGNVIYGKSEGMGEAFCQWDCDWYTALMTHGYHFEPQELGHDAANWAFFPLFPLLARTLGDLLSLNYLYAAYIISNAAFLGAMLVLYTYCQRYFSDETSLFSVSLLAFSPYSFYFSIPYTEALFLFLALLVFLFSAKSYWILAGITAALLSATRNIGAMIVFPMLIMLVQHYGIRSLVYFRHGTEKALLSILIAPLGLFLYMFFLHLHVGDALAFKHVQVAWGREIGSPVEVLLSGFDEFRSPSTYFAVITSLGIILSVYLLRKKKLAESVMLAIGIFIPLSTSLTSMPRYIFASFPVYIALALISEKSLNLRYTILALFAASFGFLVVAWTTRQEFMP